MEEDGRVGAEERFSQILICLSSDKRRQIIRELATGPRTYTQLMEKLEIDPDTQTGLLNYHLRKIRVADVIRRTRNGYELTDIGIAVSRIIGSLQSQIETKKKELEMVVEVEPYMEGSLTQEAIGRAQENGAMVDKRQIFGRKTEGLHKHIYSDLGVSATHIARIDNNLVGVLPAYTTTLNQEEVGKGRMGVRIPDEEHPANWIGGSFSSPWIDPDFAEQEDEIERALIKSFIEHCRKIGAREILAEQIPLEDQGLLDILMESGFKNLRRIAYLTLQLNE